MNKFKEFVLIFLLASNLSFSFAFANELDNAFLLFEKENYSEAFPIFLKLAKEGNPKAQGTLARMYGNGWGVVQDESQAYAWASKGALQDDPISESVMGYLYLNGVGGVNQNTDEAIKWYKKSAYKGNVRSNLSLASIFQDQKNFKKAIFWSSKSFAFGRSSFATVISTLYGSSLNDPDNFDKTIELLNKGVSNGDLSSMNYLGRAYHFGYLGLEANEAEAIKYYKMAAERGSSLGWLGFAFVHLMSDTIEKNPELTLNSLQKAATDNNEAKFYLAYSYLFGDGGIKENHAEGYELLKQLKSQDHYLAYVLESHLYDSGVDRPRNSQKALICLMRASQLMPKVDDYYEVNTFFFPKIMLPYIVNYYLEDNQLGMPFLVELAWQEKSYAAGHVVDEEYDNFIKTLSKQDFEFIQAISTADLVTLTYENLIKRQKEIGPIEPVDLINEGWHQFLGSKGIVNEPLAQYLTEEGLRLAIRLEDQNAVDTARNNLGVILDGAINHHIRNHRLAKVHLYDGKNSFWGSDNLLWLNYFGEVKLSNEELGKLKTNFLETRQKPHPTTLIPMLDENVKDNPEEIVKVLVKHYKDGDKDMASGIANAYEDMNIEKPYFEEALKWYIKEGENDRANRIRLILEGKYVKGMPNFTGTLNSLFEVDLVETRGGYLTDLTSAITDSAAYNQTTLDKSKRKLKLFALVIGNAEYKGKSLKNSTNDSKAIASKLRKLGFNVTEVANADRKKFRENVISFSEEAKNSDVTIFYYSGHGMQLGGVNYLLPIDINFSASQEVVTYEGISLNDIKNRNLPGATRLIFLDACRTNPFKENTRGEENIGLAPINVGTGTLISFATRDGAVAYDDVGVGANSPYTQSLLKHLDDNEDVDLMLRAVSDDVIKLTKNRQQPWKYGALTGTKVIISTLNK